jgi:hypothetical protein
MGSSWQVLADQLAFVVEARGWRITDAQTPAVARLLAQLQGYAK